MDKSLVAFNWRMDCGAQHNRQPLAAEEKVRPWLTDGGLAHIIRAFKYPFR
jgi:hypothetical protein